MQNIVDNLYKGQANPKKVGNGTTMDAVRYEMRTGDTNHRLSHVTKAKESINGLKKLIKKVPLNDKDKTIVEALIEDLRNALNGK